jgi:hypothetical protein
MRIVRFRRILAVLAAGLIAAGCTTGGPTARGTTSTSTTTVVSPTPTTLPTVLTSVTPSGWVPVEYGDAQVSVPADWEIGYDVGCPMATAPGEIFVGITGRATCYAGAGVPYVVVGSLPRSSPSSSPPKHTINGITVWGRTYSDGYGEYDVPELGVQITLHGKIALAVLATLTRSPATAAVAAGPAPSVPKSWRWVTAGSVRFAVPAGWPTSRTDVEGPGCGRQGIVAPSDMVVLDSDTYSAVAISCPPPLIRRPVPQMPTDGVVVDLHPQARFWPPSSVLGRCLHLHGVTACLYDRTPTATNDQMAELDLLLVQVTVPGVAGRELLEVGLAGNGTVARTVLYSLAAA